MDREDYMTRNEWLIQFVFILMPVLVVGTLLDYGARIVTKDASSDQTAVLGYIKLLAPSLLPAASDSPSTLGLVLAFIYTMAIMFLMGVLNPPKKRRRAPVGSRF